MGNGLYTAYIHHPLPVSRVPFPLFIPEEFCHSLLYSEIDRVLILSYQGFSE